MGRYRSLQSIMLAEALKGITDNQTITAYKKDCKSRSSEGMIWTIRKKLLV